jgi:hypothetical protein
VREKGEQSVLMKILTFAATFISPSLFNKLQSRAKHSHSADFYDRSISASGAGHFARRFVFAMHPVARSLRECIQGLIP